ncbi:RNA polymerase sigma-70 factor, ECF subfamily [Oceanobacillus limi]|uniref:RNA polymerase sigma-70 factor, ECF subfamily n=1 Tax=Oceanobacillus limi TaxID=930131 RepID=A0A1I0CRZ5_9BACI|nr:sigma-70 family RNA polymerase sigma factor [Oceanobacillus limi]SET21835.1 RNA polymerase sigma-70 factor, ECF subfamily [Oceanobacillus limi]
MNEMLESATSIHSLNREDAIEWIMEEYGEGLKRFIFFYVKNRAQTDDLFQEVLLTVYQKLDTYEERASLKNWLYRVTANRCKDYLRSPIHRLITWKDQMKEKADDSTPEQAYLLDEQKHTVIEAIIELPIKYREVLILQYYKEFSIQEISDLLHVNPSTVKTRIKRAKEKLKSTLKEEFLHE